MITAYIFKECPPNLYISPRMNYEPTRNQFWVTYDYGIQLNFFTTLFINIRKLTLEENFFYLCKILKISKRVCFDIEQSDVNFIKDEFETSWYCGSRGLVENEEEIHLAPIDFESNMSPSESKPIVDQPQQPQLHRRTYDSVHHLRFEIEWKIYGSTIRWWWA